MVDKVKFFAALMASLLAVSSFCQEDYFKEGEALFEKEIVASASKFAQDETNVPATTTILTHEEIMAYGFRTLADILNYASMGGYTLYDHMCDSVGMRGIYSMGDYNTRILLLINGHILNEPYNNFAGVGREFLVPMELVEKVEIIYGPHGTLYSGNETAVINVVTKPAADMQGVKAKITYGSFDTREAVLGWGFSKKLNGKSLDVFISAGQYETDGAELDFPEITITGDSPYPWPVGWDGSMVWGGRTADRTDFERSPFVYYDVSYGDLRFFGRSGYRKKGSPLAMWGEVYGDTNNWIEDKRAYNVLTFDHRFNRSYALSVRASYDEYNYNEQDAYYDPSFFPSLPGYIWRDRTSTVRTAAELNYEIDLKKAKLLFGGYYRREHIREILDDMPVRDLYPPWLENITSVDQNVRAVYGIADYAANPKLNLSAALNYVKYSYTEGELLYRASAVYHATPSLHLKAVVAKGFRAPSYIEYAYQDGVSFLANPTLQLEVSPTEEISLTFKKSDDLSLSWSLFHQKVDGYIEQVVIGDLSQVQGDVIPPGSDPYGFVGFQQYQSIRTVDSYGTGLSLKARLSDVFRGYCNLAWQRTRLEWDPSDRWPRGSANFNANFGVSANIRNFSAGLSAAYLGPMLTADGMAEPSHRTGGYFDWRLKASYSKLFGLPLRAELLVTNLFNTNQQSALWPAATPSTALRSKRAAVVSLAYNF